MLHKKLSFILIALMLFACVLSLNATTIQNPSFESTGSWTFETNKSYDYSGSRVSYWKTDGSYSYMILMDDNRRWQGDYARIKQTINIDSDFTLKFDLLKARFDDGAHEHFDNFGDNERFRVKIDSDILYEKDLDFSGQTLLNQTVQITGYTGSHTLSFEYYFGDIYGGWIDWLHEQCLHIDNIRIEGETIEKPYSDYNENDTDSNEFLTTYPKQKSLISISLSSQIGGALNLYIDLDDLLGKTYDGRTFGNQTEEWITVWTSLSATAGLSTFPCISLVSSVSDPEIDKNYGHSFSASLFAMGFSYDGGSSASVSIGSTLASVSYDFGTLVSYDMKRSNFFECLASHSNITTGSVYYVNLASTVLEMIENGGAAPKTFSPTGFFRDITVGNLGDANDDHITDRDDVIEILSLIDNGGYHINADADCDGDIDLQDLAGGSGCSGHCPFYLFGDANMDCVLESGDVDYINQIIQGNFSPTWAADAWVDREVDEDDEEQTLNLLRGNGYYNQITTYIRAANDLPTFQKENNNWNFYMDYPSYSSNGYRDLAPLNQGITCQDDATGTGYILYSEERVHDRFYVYPPFAANSDHLIAVKHFSSGWEYDDNNEYRTFFPVDTDVLIAEVDFDNDTVTDLEGLDGPIFGIESGYFRGDLSFYPNRFGGILGMEGEFDVTGSYIILNDSFDPYIYDVDPNNGIIDYNEVLSAIQDYFNNIITFDQVMLVVIKYFNSDNKSSKSSLLSIISLYDQNGNGIIEENEIRAAAEDCLAKKLSLDDFIAFCMYYTEQSEPEQIPELPQVYSLSPNYPNSFNPETTINYALPKGGNVILKVYNLKGQFVKTLVNENKETGNHSVVWNGKDNNDCKVSSGVYFYRINAGEFTDMKKMLLIK
ncbi:MAG: T9SS type A sorting domain-containing protein [Candidatus Cloacimonetes bacterium]|nr:T9SS type A sorting domain-containing protein [Candidatus Cloacimonadota bacterium]